MNAPRPVSRDKVKTADFLATLGFPQSDTSVAPASCNINRYAFELFFENVRHSELFRILSSDHLEHGFKIIAEAAKTDKLRDLQSLVNHIFIYAFLEILLMDKSERANTFLKRQSHFSSFPEETLSQLYDLKYEMADSVPVIFEHLMGPIPSEFGCNFYEFIDEFITESTAPAISHLLRPFLHNEIQPRETPIPVSTQSSNRDAELFGAVETNPSFFAEVPMPKLSPMQHPFAQFKMMRNTPTLVISRPKFIPPQIPTITCINAPRYVEYTALSKTDPEYIYSVDSKLFVCSDQEHRTLVYHISAISAVAFSDDGDWALSCDISGEVHVINVKDPNRKCDYQSTKSCITCCSFSPKITHQFAVGTMTGEVFVYSISKREIQRVLIGHSKGIVSVKIHPNSEYLASISLDQTIRLWSISMACTVRLFKACGNIPTSLRFSNSGQWLLNTATDGSLSFYDIGAGRMIKSFKAYDNPLIDALFSLNDQMIIGFDRMGNFFFWETNETYGSLIANVRIDRVRIGAIECLSSDEIRIVGCSKQNQ
ncbi:hypothetical protein TRFO_30481 [Tritrichomonas foetus]|uniref:Uncharacterized protein n=1 Tax=Tritrichomonas foetus TaxID=1144522 RepID=A0A1J4JTM3_9EUKA|nr:hypothetical protein TRFO_30481 [Tritrichomonas foetus]|eukprot:OHT02419.1 hypothetical protein TRFO_30481 [Tritrichomonas foetus]